MPSNPCSSPRSWPGPCLPVPLLSATRASPTSRAVRSKFANSASERARVLRQLVLGCVGFAISIGAFAQAGEGEFETVVERYVAEGLRSNLSLQSESLEVERAAQALAAARARFFPEVSLPARYTRAEGGREFSIPLGTTLNPV